MAQPEGRQAVPSRCFVLGIRTMPEASRSPSGLASLGSACRHGAPFFNGLLGDVMDSTALAQLLEASHAVGANPDYVQGGGGNTSAKSADGRTMLVKASGTTLSDMSESAGWVAMDVTHGVHAGLRFAAGRTPETVTHDWQRLAFKSSFGGPPVFLASLQTFNGPDPASVRYRNLTPKNVEIMVEEESSADAETQHAQESVGCYSLTPGLYRASSGTGRPFA